MSKGFDFIDETIAVLISPASFFSSRDRADIRWFVLILKIFLYVALAQLIGVIPASLTQGSFAFDSTYVLISCGLLVAAIPILFIAALLLCIISAICGGITNLKVNADVTASVIIVYPVSALMSIFYHINVYFHAVLSALVTLYGLWLLYLGLVKRLKAQPALSAVAVVLMAIFPIYSGGKTVYYKAHGLQLPHEIEQKRIQGRVKELLKQPAQDVRQEL